MNNTDVLWVGVSFNPDDNPRGAGDRLDRAHGVIVNIVISQRALGTQEETNFPSGATMHVYKLEPEKGDIIDLYDALGFRIGFGIKVDSVDHGRDLVPRVRDWLTRMGILLPVSVWTWSPSSVPSRTIRRVNARMTNVRRP